MLSHIHRLRALSTVEGARGLPALVEGSWRRCLETHRLLPDFARRADVLSYGELRETLDQEELLIRSATAEIDRLFRRLAADACTVSLASAQGVKLLFRCDPYHMDDLNRAGVLPGSVWAEDMQGTNGIGTCLLERRPLSIVGDEHFNRVLSDITCTVAPIFGSNGQLAGVLNISSLGRIGAQAVRLLSDVVNRSARRIETQLFQRRNSGHRLVSLSADGDFADAAALSMLALDDSGQIVDFTHDAPVMLRRAADQLPMARLDQIVEPDVVHGVWSEPMTPAEAGHLRVAAPSQTTVAISGHQPVATPGSEATLSDPRLDEILHQALDLARRQLPLMLIGETGTGKTTLALRLARLVSGDFLMLEGGAADDVTRLKLDTLRARPGFALVLDQIDEMSVPMQRSLVQVLEGAQRPLITVTSSAKDLQPELAGLRPDLVHRLNGAAFILPPLRSTPEPEKVFLRALAEEARLAGRAAPHISSEALAILCCHHWPGNLRELHFALRRAIALAGDTVTVAHLPTQLIELSETHDVLARSKAETARIETALRYHKGNVMETARYLGVSRATLYRKMQGKRSKGLTDKP
ncbi:sigma-54-dependent Fis family transcriptional regulator [Xinfangfangia sp. D13-10-4-6]|uniref:sigma-54-dependent Fis family transcriptional regulator n=1 Tax=Pseudogemmobacter hezensis TaxID=2737662 RepID=UPI0015578988|nr:GAF domain-containing protein [Pseudogemmobacter hezensis]NPD14984.1 sigma-54-dependent Fis family transcriptional regulator [Pseudogemmobacter hezensis]